MYASLARYIVELYSEMTLDHENMK